MKNKDNVNRNMVIGSRIRFFRQLRGLTQTDLAKKAGYTSSGTFSLIERGLSGMSNQKIEETARFLDVHPYILTADNKLTNSELLLLDRLSKIIQRATPNLEEIKKLIDHDFNLTP